MLCRYAVAEGYLSADSPDERAASLNAALQRLKATNDWLDEERFMRPRVMRSWGHVVSLPFVSQFVGSPTPFSNNVANFRDLLLSVVQHAAIRQTRSNADDAHAELGAMAWHGCIRAAGAAHPAGARVRSQQRGG